MQETGRLLAPPVGAGLFTALGGGAVALLDAATFLIAAGATSRLRSPPEQARPPRKRWSVGLLAGFAHVRDTPRLRVIVAVAAVIMAISGFGVAAQFSMVTAVGRPPAYLGVFSALLGAGSILASLTSSRVINRFGLGPLALAGLAAFTIGTALRTMPTLPTTWAGSIVLGFALPWVFLAALTAAQQLTPDHLQGRVAPAGQWGPGHPRGCPFAFPAAYYRDGAFFPFERNHFERDGGLARGGTRHLRTTSLTRSGPPLPLSRASPYSSCDAGCRQAYGSLRTAHSLWLVRGSDGAVEPAGRAPRWYTSRAGLFRAGGVRSSGREADQTGEVLPHDPSDRSPQMC